MVLENVMAPWFGLLADVLDLPGVLDHPASVPEEMTSTASESSSTSIQHRALTLARSEARTVAASGLSSPLIVTGSTLIPRLFPSRNLRC